MPSVTETKKAIRSDKVTEEPGVRRITLRGQEYMIREITTDQYEECVEAATNEVDGTVRFDRLLKVMTLRCISPSLAVRETPLPYPVYRTLEGIVNIMHFLDLPDEGAPAGGDEDGDDEEKPKTTAPND